MGNATTNTVETELTNLITTLNNALSDATKFDGGNQAAGTRVRKALQTVANGSKDLRKTIQEIKNNK